MPQLLPPGTLTLRSAVESGSAPTLVRDVPAPRLRRRTAVVAECSGLVIAAALAVLTMLRLAAPGGRPGLLFDDGDSMTVAMLGDSLTHGGGDWALSPVLFLPETAVYLVLEPLGLSVDSRLLAAGAVNYLMLYAGLRLLAGRGLRPLVASVAAIVVIHGLALVESGDSPDKFKLASLLGLTTYYSGTVLGTVFTWGLAAVLLRARTSRARWAAAAGIAGVCALSMLSNPLFGLWCGAPLVGAALLVWWASAAAPGATKHGIAAALRSGHRAPLITDPLMLVLAGACLGMVVGLCLRGLFSHVLPEQSGQYFRWGQQFDAGVGLIAGGIATLASPLALAAALMALALVVFGWRQTRAALAQRNPSATLIAVLSWAAPLGCTLLLVLCGNDTFRYFQFWVFAPVLSLIAHSHLRAQPTQRWRNPKVVLQALVGSAAALAAVSLCLVPATWPSVAHPSRDVECAVNWISTHEGTAAGSFWSVRAIKARLHDPHRLLQVGDGMVPYHWMVDRNDDLQPAPRYFVQDLDRPRLGEIPLTTHALVAQCGRFAISALPEPASNPHALHSLERAVELLPSRDALRYSNPVKQAFLAIEAITRKVTGETTLGADPKKLEKNGLTI